MNHFITNIHVNKLFHLNNIDIPIADSNYPHLIITGKNGSGKTILLNAIADFLNIIKGEKSMSFLSYKKDLSYWQGIINSQNDQQRMRAKRNVVYYEGLIDKLWGMVDVNIDNISNIIEKYNEDNFLIVFYQASRMVSMLEPKNPTKPQYKKQGGVKETATAQFLNFLSDLKIQEALARNEKQIKDAERIELWFDGFESLLRRLYQDTSLKLEFNYKDYSFKICTEGKKFKFTELSDGFSAVLDIVADLILKMQGEDTLSGDYQKEGIVLIDEIETHLHLELQKNIMPFLTQIFPNVQFIVTTHSPFVLSSMPNAVAYDLEHQQVLEDLSNYSYESLAEGYFGVTAESSDLRLRLNTIKELLEKQELSDGEKSSLKEYIIAFDKIPEAISPSIIGEYLQSKIKHSEKIKTIM
ncbi:MAG: ATP-binding protein [Bacteroidales bacterium]|nr:ATP-binding protein [Bacteroidales bacterium]